MTKKPKVPQPAVGRPSMKTEALCDRICELLIDGYSLRHICEMEGIPNRSNVFRWLEEDAVFATKYAKAKLLQVENDVDDMREIADDSRNDYMEREMRDGNISVVLNPENIARSKLRLEQRRWYAEKLKPKVYGAKIALGGDEDAPPIKMQNVFDVSNLTLEELAVFEKAITKAK